MFDLNEAEVNEKIPMVWFFYSLYVYYSGLPRISIIIYPDGKVTPLVWSQIFIFGTGKLEFEGARINPKQYI